MQIKIYFKDGPHDGKMAKVALDSFRVGLNMNVMGSVYTIQDGPAARAIAESQEENEYLMPLGLYQGPAVSAN